MELTMAISAKEWMPLFTVAVRSEVARMEEREKLGAQPCLKSADGYHQWRRKPSPVLPGHGWDVCRCGADRPFKWPA